MYNASLSFISVLKRDHISGMSHLQPLSITRHWPEHSCHTTVGMRLSWPGWLVEIQMFTVICRKYAALCECQITENEATDLKLKEASSQSFLKHHSLIMMLRLLNAFVHFTAAMHTVYRYKDTGVYCITH